MVLASDAAFRAGLDLFGSVVQRMPPGAWSDASPCAGWTALDVLGHLGSAIEFGVDLLEGRQHEWAASERPGDLVDGEPAAYWNRIAASARSALEGADMEATRDTPMGRRTVADGLAFPAIDLFVHAWDIGRVGGIDVEIPAEVVEYAHSYLDPIPEGAMRGSGTVFGPEVEPPPAATPTEAFIAWTGRTPR